MTLLSSDEARRLLMERPALLSRIGMGRVVEVGPLAHGEYHQNFLVNDEFSAPPLVLRINHGSQLGLTDQLAYEADALRALAPSGIAPRPIHYEAGGPSGTAFLLEEFIPGRPLDYATDLIAAAHLFGRLHTFRPADHRLIAAPRPFATLLQDAGDLLARAEEAGAVSRAAMARLARVHARLKREAPRRQALVDRIGPAVVNTEVNAGNFLVNDEAGTIRLVDWEKPLWSSPLVDIGHFWALSTILWKGETLPGDEQREAFLETYCAYFPQWGDAVRELFPAAVQYSALRGIAWCASVYDGYRAGSRALADPRTLNKIEQYLEPAFLGAVFEE